MDALSEPDGGRQTEHKTWCVPLGWGMYSWIGRGRGRDGGKEGQKGERKEGREGREGGREGGGLMQHYPYIMSMTKVAQQDSL